MKCRWMEPGRAGQSGHRVRYHVTVVHVPGPELVLNQLPHRQDKTAPGCPRISQTVCLKCARKVSLDFTLYIFLI